ncbi:MAG: hypothetical protein FWC47_05895 [Oscillospiraceae bacterium]|nr:hypothetical protein [Oscillospiraceae bacterium]
MLSKLKNMFGIIVIFAILSCIASCCIIFILRNNIVLINTDFGPFFTICTVFAVAVPLSFICLAVTVKRITDELHYIRMQVYELDSRLNNIENTKR